MSNEQNSGRDLTARGAPERGDGERYCPQCDSGGHECSGCGTSITHESGRACAACAAAGSLPAPPPDDVTVDRTERILRDLAGVLNTHGVDAHLNLHDFVLAKYAYESMLTLGSTVSYERTVVEGESPAPEPQAAAPPASRHTNNPCELHPVAVRGTPSTARLELAPEPRFERGFYRLAREVFVGPGERSVGTDVVVHGYDPDTGYLWVGKLGGDVAGPTTPAALAVAGAERVEGDR